MKPRFTVACLLFLGLCCGTVSAAEFEAGKHYNLIQPEASTQSEDKVEVVELFWYGCGHCYDFEPYINAWKSDLPEDVVFRRVPAVFDRRWEPHARAYFTAEKLGILDEFHPVFFDALHKERRKFPNKESAAAFFAEFGVSEADFLGAYDSFDVDAKVRKAKQATRAYRITGVPSLVINGKYNSSAGLAGSYKQLLELTDSLVAQERAN